MIINEEKKPVIDNDIHSIVTHFLTKEKKEGNKKKSKLINGKLGFFLALHDSPFSQLFILLSLQKS